MAYINGEWLETTDQENVYNPATGEVIGSVSVVGANETKEAIQAANESFKTWRKLPGATRGAYMAKAVEIMRTRADELANTITKENGKPLADAKGEVTSGINYLEWYAEEAKRVYGDVVPASHEDKHLMVLRQPVGVAAAITPWNFPFSMITRKIAPALAAGCTVVLKPAPATPLSAINVFECFHEAGVPAGVVNLVIGDAEAIGKEMTSSTDVSKLTFTGSTAVGKMLMRDSAATMKRMSMELGGHAPFIIFEDADLEAAANGVLMSKFRNAGQTCISTNRVYVQQSVASEFGDLLARKVSELTVGDGTKEGVDVGPLINDGAVQKVNEHVQDACSKGGKVLSGGSIIESDGNFFEPTVIQGATDTMRIATEETFGPVAPIFSFETTEEVIERANNSRYGLAGYCFTNDLSRAYEVMNELEYGIVGINDPTPITVQAPFGGIKESGTGKEGGKYGLDDYLIEKFVSIKTN
ncbi:NAD-dependent succinate-semialdehyde dehydrogenase [Geomicrobium sp. JCM 19038]|uniref:NAD-dependent succinate-semialdehyde dehydrogenase n=1 Tax=Geomicrobium sp. JCM 19038 TaxID=1460635 RepID=UPI00045F19DB|nr:NAD-dependent succinate-semialdehyde dehydrogenase [Geomicrobium sp. JCM 19038]GAK09219.1 succinate-semialdehyde dehydrogenase [Geomicrobium sp. JCM 19038]